MLFTLKQLVVSSSEDTAVSLKLVAVYLVFCTDTTINWISLFSLCTESLAFSLVFKHVNLDHIFAHVNETFFPSIVLYINVDHTLPTSHFFYYFLLLVRKCCVLVEKAPFVWLPQDSLYASKSTIDFGESLEDRWRSFLNQLEYIDPRGYVNIGTRQRELSLSDSVCVSANVAGGKEGECAPKLSLSDSVCV